MHTSPLDIATIRHDKEHMKGGRGDNTETLPTKNKMGNANVKPTRTLLVKSKDRERKGVKADVLADILHESSRGARHARGAPLLSSASCYLSKDDLGPPTLTLLIDNSTLVSEVIEKLRAANGAFVHWDIVPDPPLPSRYSLSRSFKRFNDGIPMTEDEKNIALAVAGLPPM